MEKIIRRSNNYIIFDSSFLVSLFDTFSPPHKRALTSFKILSERKDRLRYVLPDVVINESTVNLIKTGHDAEKVKERMFKLAMYPKTIINSSDVISAFRHIAPNYSNLLHRNSTSGRMLSKRITKTNDYVIACTALDHDAIVVGSDKQMLECLEMNGIRVFNFLIDDYSLLKRLIEDYS
jgi:predicted nucleic acid-binding protein